MLISWLAIGALFARGTLDWYDILDDDAGVLNMLRAVIDTIGVGVQIFGSAAEFFADHHPERPEQCLDCDVRMPGTSGLDVQKELAQRGEILPIIFIGGHTEMGTAVEAMRRTPHEGQIPRRVFAQLRRRGSRAVHPSWLNRRPSRRERCLA